MCVLKIKKPLFITLLVMLFLSVGLALGEGSKAIISAMSESEETVRLPIFMYHAIMKNDKSKGKYVITPDDFESDLKYIKDNGYTTIVMQDLIDFVYENKPMPEKPIMLTFDDGYYNNYLYAFPLLKKYDCKIVLSPIGKQCDRYSEIDNKNPAYAHCSWENLKEMKDSGLVEIQNHSYDMHSRTQKRCGTMKNKKESLEQYKKCLCDDVMLMQHKVEDFLDFTPTTFVFPFGAVSKCSREILQQLGFKATLGCEEKINKLTKNPEKLFGLYRIVRPPNISTKAFFQRHVER